MIPAPQQRTVFALYHPAMPSPRHHRFLRRALLSAAALAIMLWLFSTWWSVNIWVRGWRLEIVSGVIKGSHFVSPSRWINRNEITFRALEPGEPRSPFWLTDQFYSWKMGIVAYQSTNGFGVVGQSVAVLLWPLALSFAAAAGLLFWHDRRLAARSAHLCASCGYPLTGLSPSARCPECGSRNAEAKPIAPPTNPHLPSGE